MSAAELRLSYGSDDEWHGELFAVVKSGAFSGEGVAWVDRQHVKRAFVVPLRAFPLSARKPPMIEGGYWNGKGSLQQCRLRIAVRPYNSRGTLLVQADLASPILTTPEDRQQLVTAHFLAEYAALDKFASNFEQVLDGRRDSAVLRGTTE